ncbi:DUF6701 domain-containing protein [Aeromonas caviae]|uniref:MSHA biogenesis protein MshQ n=1 Tax=Aeromonas caviae TaxID=648 RepID=A0AAJ5Z5W9_AERCA|nr:DUF6701 domain-containing protein [Aeromonas caviae]UCM47840.1 MSHA biogenesis protein MshQ [Aeromonas caviae]WFF97689.1 MSHA biogenesis protein MshQ [Aeromonas caviae]
MRFWLLVLTMLSGMVHGFETVDSDTYFPAVVQGHRGNNNAVCTGQDNAMLTQNNQAKITGTAGAALNFCDSNQGSGMPLDGCDNASGSRRLCSITGRSIRGLSTSGGNRFLSSSGNDGSLGYCSAGQQLTLGSASQYQFGTISLYSACTLTFSSTRQEYRIQSLALGGAKVVLPAGDYWIDRLVVNQGGEIETRGNVRIFVNAVEFNGGRLNAAKTGSVLLFGYQNVNLNGESLVNGLVYADQALNMNNASVINGRTTSRSLFMSGTTAINDKMSPPVTAAIDHFEFDHSGQALTCNPETLTIRACANASCSQLFTDPVSAVLTPLKNGSNGWIAGSQVSYSGNTATVTFSGGTTKLQLRNNLATAITVGVSGSTPSTKPLSTTLCRAGSGALSAAACTLSFADSGFVFNVPDTLANRPQDVVISAVKKDNATQQCVPGFTGERSVGFWGTYVTPNDNSAGSQMAIDGKTISTYAANVVSPAATTLNLTFDGQGKATLKSVRYPDAGQMRLNARHDGSGDTAGLVMTGSDLFVSRPVGLCITPTQGACAAGDITCPVFKRTGDSFSLNIQAMAWQSDSDGDICTGNGTTPNFVLSDIALTSELVAPQGGVAAQVTPTRYSHVAASASLNTPALSLNEVGVFRIKATPPAATSPEGSTVSTGYFGYTIPPATSVPLGRFVPWDFNMTSGTVTPACGGFSYMSQPFGVQTVVEARNKEGSVTRNYRDAFARGALTLVAANNQDGVDRSNRLAPLAASWTEGTGKQSGQTRFMRLRELTPSLTAPEEPLPLLRLGLRVTDGETPETSFLSGRNMNPSVSGTCQSGVNCTAKQLSIPKGSDDTMIAYYGRLLASTRQGVDSAPLALPLQVQYFEGGLWRANSQDRRANSQDICTQISLAGGGIVFTDAEQRYDAATGDLILKDGTRIRLGLGNVAPGGTQVGFDAGETRFHFAPPNQAVRIPYRIVLEQQPSQPVWLADPATADHLLGEAIFGRDRGNDRIIYRREVMP